MWDWFGDSNNEAFEVFTVIHLIVFLIYLIGIISLAGTYKKIMVHKKLQRTIRRSLFYILLLSELGYQAWGTLNGIWNVKEFMPLQLCSIAGIIVMLALFFKTRILIVLAFFIGLIPSFLAILTPELPHGYPHFRFWNFFIQHICLSWASLFLLLTSNIVIRFTDVMKAYASLIAYACFVGFLINPWFEANYMFLSRQPTADTPLSMLGDGILYILNLALIGMGIFLIQFGVYRSLKKLKSH
ncbi:TIGR02206 family membrane protein [Aquibacillus albus]|uniref:Integral membrane protein (TIGR02206 family) n=1 Tax=Aquibacillus albus TaxID=1168171 RepID=A0ABS2MX88_9BACI|nr:putative integral membrane protein (TIGR02206 family) [Aquibacillus albus]